MLRYMRCSTAQRRGKDACEQKMVQAGVLEEQVGDYLGGMRLPIDYLTAVVAELRKRHQHAQLDPGRGLRLTREIERWKRLFVLGEIDEAEYRREAAPLRRDLAHMERPAEVLDVERALGSLRRAGALWRGSDRAEQREFVRTVFSRIIVHGDRVSAITPRTEYRELFILDRQERFGGGVVWLPEQDSNLQHAG